jgi:hypothetical protein
MLSRASLQRHSGGHPSFQMQYCGLAERHFFERAALNGWRAPKRESRRAAAMAEKPP